MNNNRRRPMNNNNRRQRQPVRNNRSVIPRFPPPLNPSTEVTKTFRFIALGAGSPVVTSTCIANLLTFFVGPGLTLNYSLIRAFRLRRIRMWADTLSTTTGNDCSFEFETTAAGNIGNKPRIFSLTSYGSAVPGSVEGRPTPGSAAASWQNVLSSTTATTGVSINFTVLGGAIIDVKISFLLNNGETSLSIPFAGTASPFPNTINGNYLDSTSGTPILAPVGLLPFN